MKTIADLLAEQPVFAGLPPDMLAVIGACGINTHFVPGQLLFREGSPADTFYVLRMGRVAIETYAPGRGGLVVETLGPGELVGWSWLFPPYKSHFDVVALEEVRAVALDGACLRGKCDEDPRFGYELTRRIAQVVIARLQATRMRLLDLYGNAGS
jgi:CRP-like cAMP-binding protein